MTVSAMRNDALVLSEMRAATSVPTAGTLARLGVAGMVCVLRGDAGEAGEVAGGGSGAASLIQDTKTNTPARERIGHDSPLHGSGWSPGLELLPVSREDANVCLMRW